MHFLLVAVLALQAATVIDVQHADHCITLAHRFGDTIYTAEFSLRDLRPDSFKDAERVQAEVKGGRMTVQCKDGRGVSGRVIQVERVLVHPIPERPAH